MSPHDERMSAPVTIKEEENSTLFMIKIGAVQKTNFIRKGINMLRMEKIFRRQYSRYFRDKDIDLILYSTPPITLYKIISYAKRKTHAFTYLLLKDIFPQNAVDLRMFPAKGLIHLFFRYQEKKIYEISDYIGCMSEANVNYILNHNPQIKREKVGLSPNCLEISSDKTDITCETKKNIREKYQIPLDSRVYIYGGNLGKPQDISFVIRCLHEVEKIADVYFIICGSGTEYNRLKAYMDETHPENIRLISYLPREEYEKLVSACDVGLLFLDYRFTIPNFPSRLLSYMECGLPVLACTDVNTDVGMTIEKGEFGWWCPSSSEKAFAETIGKINAVPQKTMEHLGKNGLRYLESHYDVHMQFENILDVVNNYKI
jgi:hypothetical protein